MNKFQLFSILFMLFLLSNCNSVYEPSPKITYVANDGFIIEYKSAKIGVDLFFDHIERDWCVSPSDSLVDSMKQANGPFRNIDLVAISHKHIDHFDKEIVINYLASDNNAKVVCPDQVWQELKSCADFHKVANRVFAYNLKGIADTVFNCGNITVKAMNLEHSHYMEFDSVSGEQRNRHRDIQNFGYIFTIADKRFFHSGDTNPGNLEEYEQYFAATDSIDIAFVDRMFLTKGEAAQDILNRLIRAKDIVFMHIRPSNAEAFGKHCSQFNHLHTFTRSMEVEVFNR